MNFNLNSIWQQETNLAQAVLYYSGAFPLTSQAFHFEALSNLVDHRPYPDECIKHQYK